ncbi:MAG: DUF2927 domain-containing protein [Pseudomonadota bacterium]
MRRTRQGRRRRRWLPVTQPALWLALGVALSGCATVAEEATLPYTPVARPSFLAEPVPLRAGPVARSNADLTTDFLDLTTWHEYYERLPGVSKLEEPIELRFATPGFEPYTPYLSDFVASLRQETGVDLHLAPSPSPPASTVHLHFADRETFDKVTRSALCFLREGNFTLQQGLDGLRVQQRRGKSPPPRDMSIFIPRDVSPAEVRLCFFEEIIQTLGPANDLFRLPESIFNDENAHSRPTPFDLLMLRVLYDARVKPGMNRVDAAEAVRAVLREVNPSGEAIASEPLYQSRFLDDQWRVARSRKATKEQRIAAYDLALAQVRELPSDDYRVLAFSFHRSRVEEHSPARREQIYKDKAARYRSGRRPDELRAAIVDRRYLDALYERKRYRDYADKAPEVLAVLARYGRELDARRTQCGLAQAYRRLDPDAPRTLTHLKRCLAMTRYVFGAEHALTKRWTQWVTDFKNF